MESENLLNPSRRLGHKNLAAFVYTMIRHKIEDLNMCLQKTKHLLCGAVFRMPADSSSIINWTFSFGNVLLLLVPCLRGASSPFLLHFLTLFTSTGDTIKCMAIFCCDQSG